MVDLPTDAKRAMNTRRLLFVVNVDWFFLSHRLPIAIEAMRQGYEVHIAAKITDRLGEMQSHGLHVHSLGVSRSKTGLVEAVTVAMQIWQIYKTVKPDVVHLVTIKPVLMGGILARLAGVPAMVAAVSGLGFVFLERGLVAAVRRKLVEILYKASFGHRNLKVIFQNAQDKATLVQLASLPEATTELIRGSGVDISQFTAGPFPHGTPVVMLAARLLADKGVREFVQAARLLKTAGSTARFCLVGTADLDNPTSLTQTELDTYQHEGIIELWGHRTDMATTLSAAHIVVLPSYREGLPKVLIEAAACGKAVVTTDVPGCRDAIEPGVTGVLVPARDAPALSQAIDALLDDPQRCFAMGQAGRKLAEQAFDINQVVAQHLRIYAGLIANSKVHQA
jgi:glycosyltransferase involved in cell wall biosynthesis